MPGCGDREGNAAIPLHDAHGARNEVQAPLQAQGDSEYRQEKSAVRTSAWRETNTTKGSGMRLSYGRMRKMANPGFR